MKAKCVTLVSQNKAKTTCTHSSCVLQENSVTATETATITITASTSVTTFTVVQASR